MKKERGYRNNIKIVKFYGVVISIIMSILYFMLNLKQITEENKYIIIGSIIALFIIDTLLLKWKTGYITRNPEYRNFSTFEEKDALFKEKRKETKKKVLPVSLILPTILLILCLTKQMDFRIYIVYLINYFIFILGFLCPKWGFIVWTNLIFKVEIILTIAVYFVVGYFDLQTGVKAVLIIAVGCFFLINMGIGESSLDILPYAEFLRKVETGGNFHFRFEYMGQLNKYYKVRTSGMKKFLLWVPLIFSMLYIVLGILEIVNLGFIILMVPHLFMFVFCFVYLPNYEDDNFFGEWTFEHENWEKYICGNCGKILDKYTNSYLLSEEETKTLKSESRRVTDKYRIDDVRVDVEYDKTDYFIETKTKHTYRYVCPNCHKSWKSNRSFTTRTY